MSNIVLTTDFVTLLKADGTAQTKGVKTRGKPFRDIEYAINTMAVPHLATIAYKLNRSLKWDSAKQEFIGDAEANRLRHRARREPWQI